MKGVNIVRKSFKSSKKGDNFAQVKLFGEGNTTFLINF